MEKRMNKKAQGLSTNAIILIVLGVVVLVVLVMGFWLGWGKIAPWLSSENVGTIVSSCEAACIQAEQYAFCSQERELVDAEKEKVKATCAVLAKAEAFEKYGIVECPTANCGDLACAALKVNGNLGVTAIGPGKEAKDYYNLLGAVKDNAACYVLKKAAK